MNNLFTVDCEEWFHGAGVPKEQRHSLKRHVYANTMILLELLDKHKATATFFTLADVAQEYPELISEIHRAGHELASHGSGHDFVYHLSPSEFRQTLEESKAAMETIRGKPLGGYRAPYFSLTKKVPWAFSILHECGFTYDASIAPIHNHRYGIADAPRQPHNISTAQGILQEFPMTTMFPHRFALTGGFYFRFFPLRHSIRAFHSLNSKAQQGIFYIHPWELSDFHPDAAFSSSLLRHRMLYNLGATRKKIDLLLREFSFCSVERSENFPAKLF